MLELIKKAILDITRQHNKGTLSAQEAAQQLAGVLQVLNQVRITKEAESREISRLYKKAQNFINSAQRIYSNQD